MPQSLSVLAGGVLLVMSPTLLSSLPYVTHTSDNLAEILSYICTGVYMILSCSITMYMYMYNYT